MAKGRKTKRTNVSVRTKQDATIGGDVVGRDKIEKRHIEQHYYYGSATRPDAKPSRKAPTYDVLPRSFEIWLHQEIPHVEVWFYVVNYLDTELVLQTFSITSFSLSGGPSLENIPTTGEVRIPPHQSANVLCRRPIIDSEARAIERTQQTNQSNATFSVSTRGFAGHKKFNWDLPAASANGWVRDVLSASTEYLPIPFISAKELDTRAPMEDTIQQAEELLLAGVALGHAVQRLDRQFAERLNRNARLRFMVLDPDSPDINLLAEMYGASPDEIKADIHVTLKRLDELISYAKATKKGSVEVRLLQSEPPFSFAVSNPKSANGYMSAGLRIYGRRATTRPYFILRASDKWFGTFVESCEGLWSASPTWPRHSDKKEIAIPRAGAVVHRQSKTNETEILLVTSRSPTEEWIFPVGEVEPGETLPRAAARECAEESGYEVEIETELDTIEADDGKSLKHMTFFLARIKGEKPEYEKDRKRKWVTLLELAQSVPVRFLPIANMAVAKLGR